VIPAPIVPVILDLLGPDGTVATFNGQPLTFDPRSQVLPLLRSPIFQPFASNAGFTQITDGMMRAQFWDRIHPNGLARPDNGYHLLLDPSVKHVQRMQIPFGFWFFFTDASGNPLGALVDGDVFVTLLFPASSPVDNTSTIGAAEVAGDMTTRDL